MKKEQGAMSHIGGVKFTAIFDVVAIVLIGIHIPNSIFATISIFVCIVLMLLSLVLYAKQLLSIYKELKNE